MIKNYFKTAWRSISKYRFYSGINIFGLSVGIAFTLLIGAYAWGEWQVNKNLKNADRQYIIQNLWKNQQTGAITTYGPLAKALKENYPDLIANYYRWDGITTNVSKDNRAFREGIQLCDSTMLKMYGFVLKHGNAATALNNPFTVVITTDRAIKYFGKTDAVGETLSIENMSGGKHDFMITGVMEAPAKNSVTHINDNNDNRFYIPDINLDFFGRGMEWANTSILGYVELQKGVTPKDLERPIAHLIKQNARPQDAQDLKPYLVSLKEYYLTYNNGLVRKIIFALSGIALFILAMAVINFINMSVSRSAARMREIGVRKVLGGSKRQMVLQFLTESVLIVFFATIAAIVMYACTKNFFSNLLGSAILPLNEFPGYFILLLLLFVLLVGLAAGIYPAFILSSLKSVESLKGKVTSSIKDNVWLRKSLIAFQFATATIAFTGAIIISQQINLFLGKSLGYNKDFVLSAQVPRDWSKAGVEKMETIRHQLASIPQITEASLSYDIPNGNNMGGVPVYRSGDDSTQAITADILQTDENYLSVYQIPIKAGSFFERNPSDSGRIIINKTAMQQFGWKDANNAIGKLVKIPGDPTTFTIKGVVSDFHFGPMSWKIKPIIIFNVNFSASYRYLSFKINPGNIPSTITALQKKWAVLMPGAAFEYRFMDDTLANLYKTETQLKKASYTATVLALIIVLLGVVGLISLSIQKRTKEIGIRKVLGSSVAGIITLFIKEFLWVILIGGSVTCPLAYIMMNSWLQGYAYRINITAMPFVISIICLGSITVLLICMQSIKAAMANPVKSLRTE